MLQKELERTTMQLTAEEHKRQEYISMHSSATARSQHFQSNLSLKFQRNLSQNRRFPITFGHLLDPWTPSGRDLAAKGKPDEFWAPFLFDF